jgi:hypothetical protein
MDYREKERLPVEPNGGKYFKFMLCTKFTKRLQRFAFVAFSIIYELAEKDTLDASWF